MEEMVEDLITIITHFSGMLYGMRSHKQKELIEQHNKNILGKEMEIVKEEDIIKLPDRKNGHY